MLEVALGAGGEINAKSFGGYTALHLAALAGHTAMYATLCGHGMRYAIQ
jgi:ankyrin repeat protein